MTRLHDLSYHEVTRRLREIGFRFYRQGKGSHYLPFHTGVLFSRNAVNPSRASSVRMSSSR